MFDFICHKFIKNHEDIEDPKVRERYGLVFSVFSIICNIVMVIFKLLVSFLTNSVSIKADAINNISDVGSNVATLFGFRLANKHPDSDHPYGHGRMEYVSGMIVSFLILLMGFEAGKEALEKILHPEEMVYSIVALIVLSFSVLIKLLMGFVNNKAGHKIDSETLLAAGQDSFNDSIMTGTTLICLLVYRFTNFNIDAYVGLIVSILVMKSGLEIFRNVLDTILGKAPDKELIKAIEKDICTHEEVLGIHDVMLHDYGPGSRFMSLHVEVDADKSIFATHDAIDNIENEMLEKHHILTTIHMDPVDTKDEEVKELKVKIKDLVKGIDESYNIHDFRMVKGPTHTNLVFDVLLPADESIKEEELRKIITEKAKELDKSYCCVIHFDHAFV